VFKVEPFEAETPLRFGCRKQLLVDNEVLCDWWKVRRIQEKVRKHRDNPIIVADQPWEEDARTLKGVAARAVLYDKNEDLFRMWYCTVDTGSVVAYATSEDGVTWHKPDLGLVEYAGTRHSNWCRLEPAGKPLTKMFLVQDEREDAPERRFKCVRIQPYHEDGTLCGSWTGTAFSADGTTWHQADGGVIAGGGGGRASCVWDERLGRYVMFHRGFSENASRETGRFITRQESEDLVNWSPRQTVFKPMDPTWPEVEGMLVFRHEGIYFGVANMLENEIRGDMEQHLLTSRDGYRWEHPFPREPFIPRGPADEFDGMRIYDPVMAVRGETMWFYYSGTIYPHSKPLAPIVDDGAPGLSDCPQPYRIGLATVPLDRLMGLRADEPVGAFMTRPFVVEGDELYLNADVYRELRVEIVNPVTALVDTGKKGRSGHYISRDHEQQFYPGFRREDCALVVGDALKHRVRWKGGPMGRFKGQAVRLRFLARMATVYSFQVTD